jgi:hypothetical protein
MNFRFCWNEKEIFLQKMGILRKLEIGGFLWQIGNSQSPELFLSACFYFFVSWLVVRFALWNIYLSALICVTCVENIGKSK